MVTKTSVWALALGATVAACGDDDGVGRADGGRFEDAALVADASAGDAPVTADGGPTPPDGATSLDATDDAFVTDDGGPDAAAPDAETSDGGVVPGDATTGDAMMGAGDPSTDGPYTMAMTFSAEVDGRVPTTAWIPNAPDAPVAVFVPGFQLTSSQYDALHRRLVTHGIAVVRVDPPARDDHVASADDARSALDWALGPSAPFASDIDATRVMLFGHSNGAKLGAMIAQDDARVTALLGLDPTNTGGPFGYNAERPNVLPDALSSLTIPMGFQGETENATGFMPCAPEGQNYEAFLDAATMSASAVAWTLAGADHMDWVTDPGTCFVCLACPAGSGSDGPIRDAILTLTAAFARRHLLGDVAAEAWLTGSRVPAIATVSVR